MIFEILWLLWKLRFWKCDFCEKCDFENATFVKNGLLKCDFCEICDFENAIFCYKNVNFAKNAILKCEFLEKCDFEHVIFWIKFGFLPQCVKQGVWRTGHAIHGMMMMTIFFQFGCQHLMWNRVKHSSLLPNFFLLLLKLACKLFMLMIYKVTQLHSYSIPH